MLQKKSHYILEFQNTIGYPAIYTQMDFLFRQTDTWLNSTPCCLLLLVPICLQSSFFCFCVKVMPPDSRLSVLTSYSNKKENKGEWTQNQTRCI